MGERERLELEDFELSGAEEFDPVSWLNARLARNGVPFDRLDQHLSSLGMSCQLLCQDTSESIEVASNQLVTQLPSTSRDLERMQQEALRGRAQLSSVLQGLESVDDKKRSGLHKLAEIDAVKTRVETACSALREMGSWERKVRDCEQMVHSGSLSTAWTQLTSLKEVLDAFRMLPEYAKKEDQIKQLEDNLLRSARRKAKLAVERNSALDMRSCCEVLSAMGRPAEATNIATAVFQELAEKAWQGQNVRNDVSAGQLAAAVKAVFESTAQSFEERRGLLVALQPAMVGTGDNTGAQQHGAAVSVVRAGLIVLSKELAPWLPGTANSASTDATAEGAAHARASIAIALLASYVDGFEVLGKCSLLADSPTLLSEACCETTDGVEVLPWALLREVTSLVILREMQDEAAALVPAATGDMRPSEAVLAAESNAKRLLLMSNTWAQRLEQQGAARLAAPWLACVDETCASYWRQFGRLFEIFQNTLELRAGSAGAATFDSSLLSECMQLHTIFHDSIPSAFGTFQSDVLQHAMRMHVSTEWRFGFAIGEKLRDPDVWCERLALPSSSALRAAWAALEDTHPPSSRMVSALSASAEALAAGETRVRDLVTQCCVQPAAAELAGYAEDSAWARAVESSELALLSGGLQPTRAVTAVGEHLFALVPQLERSQDSCQFQWLPLILEAILEAMVLKVLQIKQLGPFGARQCIVDLEYVQKVTDALGSGPDASGTPAGAGEFRTQLAELLEALTHLSTQQWKQKECVAKGEAFVEDPRDGCPLNRRFERVLRAALGLERAM